MIRPRRFLLLAEFFLFLALLASYRSYNVSIAFLGASTVLYYVGMTELVRRKLGRWAVRRFTVAYLTRALSWILMIASAYYTYSAVVENPLPIGPKEFVISSLLGLIGAGLNYVAVGIRNSVLWKLRGLEKSLWLSRINSVVLFAVALIPFLPALEYGGNLLRLVEVLAVPVIGSFTVLAIAGKLLYIRFVISLDDTEPSS